ncbi:MAG: hypothetical protein GY795_08100 [Desulfobacterales bacterium]|nr:hypothetical protein [Desulfobacterales bacterium]
MIAGILKKLRTNGMNCSWNTVRNILSAHVRLTTTFNAENGDVINIRTSTTPAPKQEDIYNKLKIKLKPLKRVKIRIPLNKSKKFVEKLTSERQ